MPSLVTEEDKAAFVSAISDLFDTFKRSIKIIKFKNKTIISTDSNYNFIYGDNQGKNLEVTYEKEEITIDAVIRYGKMQKLSFSTDDADGGGSSTDVQGVTAEGDARIKVRRDGYEALKDCKSVEVDGILFKIDGSARPSLTFGSEYYSFILKRVN